MPLSLRANLEPFEGSVIGSIYLNSVTFSDEELLLNSLLSKLLLFFCCKTGCILESLRLDLSADA